MDSPSPTTASICLPGEWSDAWLYKEHLVLWRRDNTMITLKVDRVISALNKETDPATSAAIEFVLFRNDWKVSDQFKKLARLPGVLESLRTTLASVDGAVVLDADGFDFTEPASEPLPGALLDTTIYADRVYGASSQGLFESYLFDGSVGGSPVKQLLRQRVSDVSAGYGCVNASAGAEGLWHQLMVFGAKRNAEPHAPFRQVADFSVATSHASRHLMNYVDNGVAQFLRARAEKTRLTERSEHDAWQVLGYEDARDLGPAVMAALSSRRKTYVDGPGASQGDPSDLRVLGNSNYRLLFEVDERLEVIDVAAYEEREVTVRPDRQFAGLSKVDLRIESVLQTYAVDSGFLVESFDDVRLLTASGSHLVFDGPAARVRTFRSSRRYHDMAAVITDDALHLIGFLP